MFAATEFREHMEVVGVDGRHVGTVDHFEAMTRSTTRNASADGEHHFLAVELIERVEDQVHLKVSSEDAQFQLQ